MQKKFLRTLFVPASLIFSFIGFSMLTETARGMAEEEKRLSPEHYVVVRAWGPSLGQSIQAVPYLVKHALTAMAGKPVGHASLEVISPKKSTYVSFWPGTEVGKKDERVSSSLHTYASDVVDEKGTPGCVVKLYSLNNKLITSSFKRTYSNCKKRPQYVLMPKLDDEQNCCTSVLNLLEVGGLNGLLLNKHESMWCAFKRTGKKPFLTTNLPKYAFSPSHIADFALAAQMVERNIFPKIEGWQ